MKKSTTGLNKDWKRKYVVISRDGLLTYYRSIDDHLKGHKGKQVDLKLVAVKSSAGKFASCSTIIRNRRRGGYNCSSTPRLGVPTRQSLSADTCVLKSASAADRPVQRISNPSLRNNVQSSGTDLAETPVLSKRFQTPKKSNKYDWNADDLCFTIVAVNGREWAFRANSESEREEWIKAIQDKITSLLVDTRQRSSNSFKCSFVGSSQVRLSLRPLAGNQVCADCCSPEPEWASVNLGILICIDCSGSHRDLGSHISRVRSLDLDKWTEELLAVMRSFGNQYANRVWEADRWQNLKPTPKSSREQKDEWIKMKYKSKRFMPIGPESDPEHNLFEKLVKFIEHRRSRSLYSVIHTNPCFGTQLTTRTDDGRSLVHIAAASGDVVGLQLLIWAGADAKAWDNRGRSAIWYARRAKKPACESVLASYGVKEEYRT